MRTHLVFSSVLDLEVFIENLSYGVGGIPLLPLLLISFFQPKLSDSSKFSATDFSSLSLQFFFFLLLPFSKSPSVQLLSSTGTLSCALLAQQPRSFQLSLFEHAQELSQLRPEELVLLRAQNRRDQDPYH